MKSKKKSLYSRAWYSTPHYKKGQKCTLDLRDETLELLITTFLWWRRGGGVFFECFRGSEPVCDARRFLSAFFCGHELSASLR